MELLVQAALLTLGVMAATPSIMRLYLGARTSRVPPCYLLLCVGGYCAVTLEGRIGQVANSLMAFAASILLVSARQRRLTSRSWMVPSLLLLIWLWFTAIDLLSNNMQASQLVAYAVALAIPVCVWSINRLGGLPHGVAASATIVFLAIAVFQGLITSSSFRECDAFKCSAFGTLYKGPFASENFIAVVAVFALFHLVADREIRRRGKVPSMLFLIALIAASGSRSALVVCACTCVWMVIGRIMAQRVTSIEPDIEREDSVTYRWRIWRPYLATSVITLCWAAMSLIADARSDSFSNRGAVWIKAYRLIAQDHFWTGLGLSRWSVLRTEGYIPDHFAHSQYLIFLFSGGVVGVIMFGCLAFAAMHGRSGVSAWATLASLSLVTAFLIYGISEVIWNPLALDAFSFLAIGVLATPTAGSKIVTGNRVRVMAFSVREQRGINARFERAE